MSGLESIDAALFRFLNGRIANSLLDSIMPAFAGNIWFWPVLLIFGVAALWKGGARGRLCVLMLVVTLVAGDCWITNMLKNAVARPRPCYTLADVNLPMTKSAMVDASSDYRKGCSSTGSFP